MPRYLKQLSREAYCSVPPLPLSTIRPPRLTRESEAGRPRAPLDAPFGELKAEISLIESVEFVADKFDFKPEVKIPVDPRQFDGLLRVGLAALAKRPPPSSSSSSAGKGPAAAASPSRFQEPWGIRHQNQGRIPKGDLGPADPPRKRGRPIGLKS